MNDRDTVVVEESGRTIIEIQGGDDVRNVVIDSETVTVVSAIEQGPPGAPGGEGAINTVNGQIGDVVLYAGDVHALPDTTVIPVLPDLADVATSGDYGDLLNKPIPVDVTGKADKTYVDAQDAAVASSAQAALVVHTSRTDNPHSVTRGQIGLGNVDNTSDANKPVSTAQAAINTAKVDKVAGKGLSTNDYTTVEQTKLGGIAAGSTQNASDVSLR